MADPNELDPVDQKLNELDPERIAELAWPMWRRAFQPDAAPAGQPSAGDLQGVEPPARQARDHQPGPETVEALIARLNRKGQQAEEAFRRLPPADIRRWARAWLEVCYRPYAYLQEVELHALTRLWFNVRYDFATWQFTTGQTGGSERHTVGEADQCLDALSVALDPQAFAAIEQEVITGYRRAFGPRRWHIYRHGTTEERQALGEATYHEALTGAPRLLDSANRGKLSGQQLQAFRTMSRRVWDRVRQGFSRQAGYSESADSATLCMGDAEVTFLADGFYLVGPGEAVCQQKDFGDPTWLTDLEHVLAAMEIVVSLAGIDLESPEES